MRNAFSGIAALLLLLSGCAGGDDPAGNEAKAERARLSVEDFEFHQLPEGDRVVTGTVVNASDETIPSAQIQIALYDADNLQIGSMLIPVQGIDPGEHQPFRSALDTDKNVRSVKARSIFVQ